MSSQHFIRYDDIHQILTLEGVTRKKGRNTLESDLGILENATCVVDPETETIVWLGEGSKLPPEYGSVAQTFSSEGEIWLPELVECHTHLIFLGARYRDYSLRCAGKSYQDVAAMGGGILSTIQRTRKATLEELVDAAHSELERFQKFGIGTIEIKSGYGLDLESELKILECIRILQQESTCVLVPTFMPAHATPPEFKGKADEYIEEICKHWIPVVRERHLAEFCDVFVEEGYFNLAQARRVLECAKEHGFKLKLHADQFKDLGGTPLGIEMGATSIDHLDNISEDNIRAFSKSDTVAVLLPGASLFTGTPFAPARKLIDAGARVALSTDYNPGTSPTRNLPLMTTLACSQMKMTVPEAIAAITYNAAAALGLENELGSLQVGKKFRVCQLKAESYEMLPYSFGEME